MSRKRPYFTYGLAYGINDGIKTSESVDTEHQFVISPSNFEQLIVVDTLNYILKRQKCRTYFAKLACFQKAMAN